MEEGGGAREEAGNEKETKSVSNALLNNKYKVVRELPRGGQSRIFVVHKDETQEDSPPAYLVMKEMARR